MAVNFLQMLQQMNGIGASDLHLKADQKPIYRIYGRLQPAADATLTNDDIKMIAKKIVPERLHEELEGAGSVDFAFSIDKNTRFRGNAYHQRENLSIALRLLQNEHLPFEELHLPKVMYDIADYRRGMVLVTGPTGSGKSTTMASLIHHINLTRAEHIITIEDPVEFLHDDIKSLIQQREVGTDAQDFVTALKHALRQDPDVILVGEMRDEETITTATRAAMTGHLVISTLHTISATQTMARILKYYPAEEQDNVRQELASALRAVIAQRLLPMAGGRGRVPQLEIMIVNDMVKKLIRQDRIEDVDQVLKNGMDGMQHFDLALVNLATSELVDAEEVESYAEDVAAFRRLLKTGGAGAGGDRTGLIGAM